MLTNDFEEFLTLIKRVADKDLDQDQDKYLILSEIIRPESAYNPDPQNNYFLSNLPEYKICIPKNLNIKVSSFLESSALRLPTLTYSPTPQSQKAHLYGHPRVVPHVIEMF